MSTATDVSLAKAAQLKARQAARNRLCVGPQHPGHPTDYRYVFRESCELSNKTTKSKVPIKPIRRSVTQAQTNKEIKLLEHILRVQYDNKDTGGASVNYLATLSTFSLMANPLGRLKKFPDPEERYVQVMKIYEKRNLAQVKYSRYRVMAMLQGWLPSVTPETDGGHHRHQILKKMAEIL